MKIFLDFDDVVFNTKEFLTLLRVTFKEHGVSEELFKTTYEILRAEGNGKGFCYRFDRHIEKIREHQEVLETALLQALDELMNDTSQFVFSDVREFISVAQQKGYQVEILSFGDEYFQARKITSAGIEKLVNRVIVTQVSKERILLEEGVASGENTWFFDDRIHFLQNMKEAFPDMKTALVSRAEGRFHEEKTNACDYFFTSLGEAIPNL